MPLLGVGVFLLSAGLWKSLDPRKKLGKKAYRTLFQSSAFVTWFLYAFVSYLYARNLWAFSAVGFITVALFLGGLLGCLIRGMVRAATPRVQAALNSPSLLMAATPETNPRALRWQILVAVWALLCVIGAVLAVFMK